MNDWKFLCDQVKVREDSRYLHHQEKPVVLLWGLGFKDRPWSPEQGEELIRFSKDDPQYGGVYLIGGVDPHWRTLRGESRTNAAWTQVYRMFDAISPWDAGRYRDNVHASLAHAAAMDAWVIPALALPPGVMQGRAPSHVLERTRGHHGVVRLEHGGGDDVGQRIHEDHLTFF